MYHRVRDLLECFLEMETLAGTFFISLLTSWPSASSYHFWHSVYCASTACPPPVFPCGLDLSKLPAWPRIPSQVACHPATTKEWPLLATEPLPSTPALRIRMPPTVAARPHNNPHWRPALPTSMPVVVVATLCSWFHSCPTSHTSIPIAVMFRSCRQLCQGTCYTPVTLYQLRPNHNRRVPAANLGNLSVLWLGWPGGVCITGTHYIFCINTWKCHWTT